jgi:hypothetical protein
MTSEHKHTNKILKWGWDDNHEFSAVLFGCSLCEVEPQETRFEYEEDLQVEIDHSNCDTEPCFQCKMQTLLVNTGDAGRAESMSSKKWDSELEHYRKARAQGIQPAGTTMKAIKEAEQASDNLGSAFNAESMGAANAVTKSKAKLMKETGVA